jgi:hypothetical protein
MSSQPSQTSFHRTAEGRLAAQVADIAFLALAAEGEGFRVAYATNLASPPERWTRRDFFGLGPLVTGEAGFRVYVESQAEHYRQLASLNRRDVKIRATTPGGPAQQSRIYGEGVIAHSTAGHGGFHLDASHNALVDRRWRDRDGWYEEDAEWAIVSATFPELFTSSERAAADKTLRHSEPDAYEAIFCFVLEPGQSRVKDERRFKRDHAADWIVVAAITSGRKAGFVECIATLGGDRCSRAERRYLVPAADYEIGPFGFVIDPLKHAAYDGPSDFIGWRREHPTGWAPPPTPTFRTN